MTKVLSYQSPSYRAPSVKVQCKALRWKHRLRRAVCVPEDERHRRH